MKLTPVLTSINVAQPPTMNLILQVNRFSEKCYIAIMMELRLLGHELLHNKKGFSWVFILDLEYHVRVSFGKILIVIW